MPNLYVVATPIGNLEDISRRALRVLREVKLIATEDTRKTRRLLNTYEIKTPLTSYHEHNEREKLDYILDCLREHDVALVSEAGMPGVSDPGYDLIAAASERGLRVIPVPGPSAVITALAVSGLPTDRFLYLGFPPRRAGARQEFIKSVAEETGTLVLLEAPHRVKDTLHDLWQILGDRKITVCRELTKIHEEVFRGTVSQAIEHFPEPRGEFTLVVAGRQGEKKPELTEDVKQQLHSMYQSGQTAREAIAKIAQATGLSRRELYQTWLRLDSTLSDKKKSYQSSKRS